jgi:hypothetical protein
MRLHLHGSRCVSGDGAPYIWKAIMYVYTVYEVYGSATQAMLQGLNAIHVSAYKRCIQLTTLRVRRCMWQPLQLVAQ